MIIEGMMLDEAVFRDCWTASFFFLGSMAADQWIRVHDATLVVRVCSSEHRCTRRQPPFFASWRVVTAC